MLGTFPVLALKVLYPRNPSVLAKRDGWSPWLLARPVAMSTTERASGFREPNLHEELNFDGFQGPLREFENVYLYISACTNPFLSFLAVHTMLISIYQVPANAV